MASLAGDKLPSLLPQQQRPQRRAPSLFRIFIFTVIAFVVLRTSAQTLLLYFQSSHSSTIPVFAAETLQKCHHLHTKPGPPPHFNLREESDRYAPGTRATFIRNATIWTGGVNGLETVQGDLLLDRGLIKAVGKIAPKLIKSYTDLVTFDAGGAWVTPGSVISPHLLYFICLTRPLVLLISIHI